MSDAELEEEIVEWIAQVEGTEVEGDLMDALATGVLLCNLVNALAPGSVRRISKSKRNRFAQTENITAFQTAAYKVPGPSPLPPSRRDLAFLAPLLLSQWWHGGLTRLVAAQLGVQSYSMFDAPTLQDRQNPGQVLICLHALKRWAARRVRVAPRRPACCRRVRDETDGVGSAPRSLTTDGGHQPAAPAVRKHAAVNTSGGLWGKTGSDFMPTKAYDSAPAPQHAPWRAPAPVSAAQRPFPPRSGLTPTPKRALPSRPAPTPAPSYTPVPTPAPTPAPEEYAEEPWARSEHRNQAAVGVRAAVRFQAGGAREAKARAAAERQAAAEAHAEAAYEDDETAAIDEELAATIDELEATKASMFAVGGGHTGVLGSHAAPRAARAPSYVRGTGQAANSNPAQQSRLARDGEQVVSGPHPPGTLQPGPNMPTMPPLVRARLSGFVRQG
jgi:hypothetical protein